MPAWASILACTSVTTAPRQFASFHVSSFAFLQRHALLRHFHQPFAGRGKRVFFHLAIRRLVCAPSHVSKTTMAAAVDHTPTCTGTVWWTTKQQWVQYKRVMMDTMKQQHNLNPKPWSRAHQLCCRNEPSKGWPIHKKVSNKSILCFHLVLSM